MPPTLSFAPISTWEPGFLAAIRRHYTGSRGAPPGRKLAWEIWEDGALRGWLGVGEPAYKASPRRCLGLDDARPLPGTVADFIYRLEEDGWWHASEILRAAEPVVAAGWLARYGEEVVHRETLVLPSAVASVVPGACYRRAGYRSLGYTTGRSARRPPGHTHGPRVWVDGSPKLMLYKGPLHRVRKRCAACA